MGDSYNSLPKFDLISKLSNIPNCHAYDIDNNLLPQILNIIQSMSLITKLVRVWKVSIDFFLYFTVT